MEVADKATVADVVSDFAALIHAHAASAHLVEIPGGRSHAHLAGT